mmetsp:Transcript_23815/g.28746  ORF Transcript_23815/g.28746 Transcript_23815/m.28746 type:complete len:327 (-) Transcript_23815:185-1165(-)|eukprot:CAMPEP_0197861350 /NCGR_PEP_ID=MMETSP1438-20131217/37353_1 /TAXON_ID=1461541 /ORGANISM="Pterosperma sp., Strain CCMP1384" /LENGTH=326 /DNA_ID=CAMNT_0043478499 /DNA_START=187 /DNA_END=1167 /DNA_ORIENTATION=+
MITAIGVLKRRLGVSAIRQSRSFDSSLLCAAEASSSGFTSGVLNTITAVKKTESRSLLLPSSYIASCNLYSTLKKGFHSGGLLSLDQAPQPLESGLPLGSRGFHQQIAKRHVSNTVVASLTKDEPLSADQAPATDAIPGNELTPPRYGIFPVRDQQFKKQDEDADPAVPAQGRFLYSRRRLKANKKKAAEAAHRRAVIDKALNRHKQLQSLKKRYEGLENMTELPELLIVTNPYENMDALREAAKMNIPVVTFVDGRQRLPGTIYPIVGNPNSVQFVYGVLSMITEMAKPILKRALSDRLSTLVNEYSFTPFYKRQDEVKSEAQKK